MGKPGIINTFGARTRDQSISEKIGVQNQHEPMKVIHLTEQDERAYLEQILQKLEWALLQADDAAKQFSKAFRQNEEYLYDQRSGMDEADVVSAGQSFKRMAFQGESAIAAKRRLIKLMESPYFGRIDFTMEGRTEPLPIYIGVHSFADGVNGAYLIYDWRAPVSSMFYDFELGNATYQTMAGTVKGRIERRRQYRIRQGKMEYMIENDINIQDDVLQKELSQSSDNKMKNIVATIQRDQNAVIRNESSPVLIIQGVAGSGKTSIAIHRIAFLLYRFRDTIASGDILIISPNKVFADYISNVLPELGEAQIPELEMEDFANDLLDHKIKFHSFLQQVFTIISGKDNGFIERVRFKSSAEFITLLNRYLIYLENHLFVAPDLQIGQTRVPGSFILEQFKALQRVPLLSRLPLVNKAVQQHVQSSLKRKLSGHEKTYLYKSLSDAWGQVSLLELYRRFYDWLGRKDLFKMDGNALEYADVFPLIYCKIRLEGIRQYQEVKHLVVDEMQDYTPIQYTVLARLFPCKKTILGDANQAVNPHNVSTAGEIHRVFPQADVVRLFKSYRSTYEITRFTLGISANPDLVAVERHGPEPEVKGYQRSVEEEQELIRLVSRFRSSGQQSMAIICKTPSQAKSVNKILDSPDVYLLAEESTAFRTGVVITTVPLAKGLEFDEVVVPFVSADHYQTDLDKSLLYIACTRALHQLTLTFTKERSRFLIFVRET
jgi:DNA helicase II / ATP-dependent DNA helicase PcrA